MALVAETPQPKSLPAKQPAAGKPSVGYHQVDNTFRLTTPENISFEYQLAGPFRRLFPYLLDLIIVLATYSGLIFLIWVAIIFIGIAMAYLGLGNVSEVLFAIGAAIIPIGLFLAYWFYGAYFETYYNGRTFGKMVTSLRVISTDGHAIDGTQATLRNFFRGIDLMPLVPVAGLLENSEIPQALMLPTAIFGLVVMSLSPKFQRLGDLVAGTMVVNEDGDRNPHVQTFSDTRVPELAEIIPSSFYVSNSLAKAVAVYVERREQLGVARSGEIATKLAGTLAERFGLQADTDPDLLICSLYYKIFVGESNLDNESNSDSNSEYSNTPSPTAVVNPAAAASRYERPTSVIEPSAATIESPVTSQPTMPAENQIVTPTNPELE